MTETASPTGAPTTQGFAAQWGLIRPTSGRQIAGVCAGIGRATDSDPLLWRVLFAVGVLFGGVGLVAYLLGWLLMPAEGDTGSPVEALFGRGHSSTSAPAAVLLAGGAVILSVITIQWTPLIVLAVAVVGYLMYREYVPRTRTTPAPPPPAPPGGPGTPSEAPPPGYSWPTGSVAPTVPSEPTTLGQPAAPPQPPTVDEPATPAEPSTLGPPAATAEPSALGEPVQPEPGSVEEPGAPTEPTDDDAPDETDEAGGSAAGGRSVQAAESGRPVGMVHATVPAESETLEVPVPPERAEPGTERDDTELLDLAERYRTGEQPPVWSEPPAWQAQAPAPPQPPLPPAPPQPPQPQQPPKPRSRLGRVALSAMLLVLGLVGASALLGANPGFSGYAAAALAVVGAALVVGAWYGRSRGLIAVGALLSVVLAISSAAERVDVNPDGQQSWTPASVAEIQDEYKIDLGDGNLDLTGVDFTGEDVTIELTVNAGNLQVIVPPDVDVVGHADVSFGSASIVGRDIEAAGGSDQDFSNLGEDQATGPGRITLDVKVNAGNLEVTR